MKTPPRFQTAIWLLLAACISSSGCTWFKNGSELDGKLARETSIDEPEAPQDVTSGKKVRWDGAGVVIGETDSMAWSPKSFLSAIADFIDQKRMASAQDLVRSYPDIALQTLQESECNESSVIALQMIGTLLDDTWECDEVWQAYARDLQRVAQRKPTELDVRMRFWRFLKNHQPDQALDLKITKTLQRDDGVMLRAEFHRLESIAAMMNDNPDGAIENLETAIRMVDDTCPWFSARLKLLLGEYYRHANRTDDWKSTWNDAVATASQVARLHLAMDPQFWNRAAFLRPAGLQWPEKVIDDLKFVLAQQDLAGTANSVGLTSDESVIWFSIATEHLVRGEGQNALLAFKKAEALETDAQSIKTMKLFQARSLVASGQLGAASAILFRLVSENENTVLADRAKAILGSMKLQNGSVSQGLNLIESAIQSKGSWPQDERLRVQADYSLALLMRGRESEGLKQLDMAAEAFNLAGEPDQARQCLWNRARYFEKTGQSDLHTQASKSLAESEARLY